MKTFEVELRSRSGFVWCHIPKIKVNATDRTGASYKALEVADKKLGFRKMAIEVVKVKEV